MATELRAAQIGDAKVPLLGATKRLLAEADAMRASRTRGGDSSDDEDVFRVQNFEHQMLGRNRLFCKF